MATNFHTKPLNIRSRALRIQRQESFRSGRARRETQHSFTPLNAPRVGSTVSTFGETPLPWGRRGRGVCASLSGCSSRLEGQLEIPPVTQHNSSCRRCVGTKNTAFNLGARGRGSRGGPTQPSPLAEAASGRGQRSRGGISAPGSVTAYPSRNSDPWSGGEAQVGEERALVLRKPCLGAMGGEVRLPPGEPCREGEFCPEPGDLESGWRRDRVDPGYLWR